MATTDAAKNTVIATFIKKESGIKRSKVMTELLRNQLLGAFEEEFYMELKECIYSYDKVDPKALLNHIFKNYVKIDNSTIFANKCSFDEPPNMSRPIDVYFCKQEECQILETNGGIPITEAEMVSVFKKQMGATGLVVGAYTKWQSKSKSNRTWKNRKKFFRESLWDRESRKKSKRRT